MTAPRYAWTTVTDASLAADKALTRTKVRALRGNLEHVRDWAYDRDTHVPRKLHDHDGINSARILMPGPNWVEQASLNGTSVTRWTKSGGTWGSRTGDAGWNAQTAGDYIYIPLGSATQDVEDGLGTNGATLNVSCFIKRSGALTAGKITFGLTDAATPPTWISGCSAGIPYDLLTATYQRFYFTANPGNTTGVPRFGAYINTTFAANAVRVDCVQVTPGSQLAPWHPMPNDPVHFNYRAISQNCPCWDSNIAHVNAVRVAAS